MEDSQQNHTYLRYECADTFGLVTSAGGASSTRVPPSDKTLALLTDAKSNNVLLTTGGSYCQCFDVKTGILTAKLGHAEFTGVGTGRALNASQVLCLDAATSNTGTARVATGWIDGSVRVFELPTSELTSSSSSSTAFSLLDNEDDQERPEPLTLNGHAPAPVSAIALQKNTQESLWLASGGSDGTVIVWDLIAESGLFRLLGHHGAITQLHFFVLTGKEQPQVLLTSSLDGLVKVWDLQAQCCVQTIANMRGQIWASALLSTTTTSQEEETDGARRHRLLAGSVDGQVRVWNLQAPANNNSSEEKSKNDDWCHDMGFLEAPNQHLATSSSKSTTHTVTSKEKVTSIQCYRGRYVAMLQANAKVIHVYGMRSTKDSLRKKQRRIKRRQEKQSNQRNKQANSKDDTTNNKKRGILDDDEDDEKHNDTTTNDNQDSTTLDPEQLKASDEIEYLGTIKASHKVKAFVFVPLSNKKQQLVQIACALSTNTIELYALPRSTPQHQQVPSEKIANLTPLPGHPTGVRSIALSSNDEMAATVAKGTCKIWNVLNRSCLQSATLEPMTDPRKQQQKSSSSSFQGLCAVFLPGNTHVLVGTKEGHLLVLDSAAAEIVYWEEKAHDDAIWSMDVCHSKPTSVGDAAPNTSIITGSADKTVKFWTLEQQGEDDGSDDDSSSDNDVLYPGAPMIVQTRALEMTDEVVAVKFSTANYFQGAASRRLVFVSTLDCTIKIFFEDSLKLFLSMYGHKLPALAVDASDDDTLLVSGSADKTIKIWGLDFGDTHKTLHGHEDSVTDVRFVRGTHNFFSASKDSTVRFWDGDRFEMILVLRGHSAEVNSLAVSKTGAFCLSGGMDRMVRVWERTRDIVFLEEERERELEQIFDKEPGRREEGGTAAILDRKGRNEDDDDDEMKDSEPQSEAAVKQTLMSISAGDRLLEALELADQELQASRSNKSKGARSFNPMLLGMEPPQYVLWVVRSIKSADLEQALLVLPLGHAERLLYYLVLLLRSGHSSVELCCRASIFTVKTFQKQLILNQGSNAPLLRELRRLVHMRLQECRDTVGYNLAACRMVGRIAKERRENRMMAAMPSTDIWAGLGLGSDVAAALEGNSKKGKKRR
ncbi:WD repeat domain 3 [Seminavis robusta]|uniref:WD repeat domain 3 n=1 Tax=Seminavis robusta TaxID=568900 RepID=A0A9N8EVJ8_9STRA|nr:WD repeat domain 3 [Seminavis robusta]|eukprot:Sro1810_g299130.1 WD repeat domain 3 (1110) ;mRNA; r:9901-13510